MTTKYGVFSETGHGIANPYIDTVKPDPRDNGLNFKVGGLLLVCAAVSRWCGRVSVCCTIDTVLLLGVASSTCVHI